ncbi:hypothetical protein GLOTRDRAFT_118401 [Gloeophyllum trabeum ATCC 11539]|uniref:Uncharacterized protein n=1 Tax=Gloeophyllum trabeum (strain ATCC 11539 / FP-39264 / Madison 617) TaxID=670483 RepID=S7PS73_GLOTA|nr:uncharacterized protein GLOTRDRAFT_118401 [Gloeophyllum trabeum ATCC 11539]EPQ50243.1 hypothetical protein GLOTRDRAFT_118401 [Gloeophyllum trabeum ATCC 11539]
MSDEYASTGYKGSLVNNSEDPREKYPQSVERGTGNYPSSSADDSTSEGGYGSARDPYSPAAQRGHPEKAPSFGLVNQSVPGGPTNQAQDAQQGTDRGSRREYEGEHGGQGLDPYGASSLDSRREAEEALAGKYRGARDVKEYESGATLENDQGA